jgi:hypothetical protein
MESRDACQSRVMLVTREQNEGPAFNGQRDHDDIKREPTLAARMLVSMTRDFPTAARGVRVRNHPARLKTHDGRRVHHTRRRRGSLLPIRPR